MQKQGKNALESLRLEGLVNKTVGLTQVVV